MDPAHQAYFYNNLQDPPSSSFNNPVSNILQGCPASTATGNTRQHLHPTLPFPSPGSSIPSSDHINLGPNDWSGDYMDQHNSNWQHQQVQRVGNTGLGPYPQQQQQHAAYGIAERSDWPGLAQNEEPAGLAGTSGFPASGGHGMTMMATSGSSSPAPSAAAAGALVAPRSPDEGSGQLEVAHARSEMSGEGPQASAGVDEGAGGAMGKVQMPNINLQVCCGDMVGVLLVAKSKIILNAGQANEKEVSPTEFERLGGRSATKKWKQSIKLIDDNGEPGRPVGEWYVTQGLEQPKKPREAKEWGEAATSLGGPSGRHAGDMHGMALGAAKPGDKLSGRRPVRASARHAVAAAAAAAAAADGSPPDSPDSTGGPAWQQQQQQPRGRRSVAAPSEDQGSGTIQPPATFSSQQQMGSNWAAASGAPAAGARNFQEQQAATAALSATLAMDAAALGPVDTPAGPAAAPDWQPSLPGGGAPGSSDGQPVLLPVPVAAALPGDASQAVVEMTAYLEGKRLMPPWRLLPQHQRPLLGRLLVPLRQLFIMVMQAGGYLRIKDELLAWQGMAVQLGLPAWPCPEVPDPLRVLQQVYRDYLLRFEGRFALAQQQPLQQQPQHNSPGTTSSMTQYGMSCSAALTGPAGGGVQLVPNFSPATSAVGPADHNMAASRARRGQDHMQQLHMQLNSALPSAAGATDLDDLMSGDLVSILTDLIPEDEDDMTLMPPPPAVGGRATLQAGAAGQEAAATDSVVAAAVRTQFSNRQHPEMTNIAQRQRRQQLLQQLQAHAQGLGLGPGAQPQTGEPLLGSALRTKRPAPLIRCGDSDVINLLDQSEVSQLLRDHELHQQQQASGQRQQQGGGVQQLPAGRPVDRTISIELQRLLAGYGDGQQQQQRQEQHLQPLPEMQQQQLVQEAGGQQQDEQLELQAQAPEEEMSGMLEALQLEQQQPASHLELRGSADDCISPAESPVTQDEELHQQRQQQPSPVENNSREGWPQQVLMSSRNALLMQKSMGAHLVDMLHGSANNSSGSNAEGASAPSGAQDMSVGLPSCHLPSAKLVMPLQQQAAAADPQGPTADDMQLSQQLPPRPVLSIQQQQQLLTAAGRAATGTHQPDLAGPPAAEQLTDLPAFRGGLLRLTTPNSMLIGSVLDSPTGKGPSVSGWMDMPMPGHNLGHMLSADLQSMAAELAGVPGAQDPAGSDSGAGAAKATGSADPLASVLKMW